MRSLRLAIAAAAVTLALPCGAADAARGDARIAESVLARLHGAPRIGQLPIDATVTDGKVVLTGTVRRLDEAWEAVDLASRARGAMAVESRIEVEDRDRGDEAVASDVRRAFELHPELTLAAIHVEVSQGKVILSGRIGDARDRFVARDAAASVAGAVDVEDRLSSPPADDKTILAAVQEILGPGSLTQVPGVIEPKVKDGVVTLGGTVASPYDRRVAERLVLGINGVRGVVDSLAVEPRRPEL